MFSRTARAKPFAPIDVVVIGAGQSGLAAGYYLKAAGLNFMIVDRARRIGDVWRQRYDSLKLYTPRAFDSLPGLPIAGDPAGYPDRLEFADYLERYAAYFDLPVRLGTRIDKVRRLEDGTFELQQVNQETIHARKVIIALGSYPSVVHSSLRKDFAAKVVQLNMATYKNPDQLPPGPVLVVGDGASGRELAAEVATTHKVILATGRRPIILPSMIFGKSLFWWLERLGVFDVRFTKSGIGVKPPLPSSVPTDRRLAALGVSLRPRLISASGDLAKFQGGTTEQVRTVIWANGYWGDSRWIDVPEAKDDDGFLLHDRGVSQAPNLYFLGRLWQSGMASGLVCGAGPDAEHVVDAIIVRSPHGN